METLQFKLTRSTERTVTPVQRTIINNSYNTTKRKNQDSQNRTSNHGGRRRQDAEIEPDKEDERFVRQHRHFPTSRSDGGLWESPSRAEHEAMRMNSSAPPTFNQVHDFTQNPSHSYSRSVELDEAQATVDNCPACGQPLPQTDTRDVTGHDDDDDLQDSDLQPLYDHYEHNISAPQPRSDDVPSVHRPREARSGRSSSDWPSDYAFGDRERHGTRTIVYDDQHQPLLLNDDDRPASSRHCIPVLQEPQPSRQSYNPRLESSERLVDTRARAPPPSLPPPSVERFEVRSPRSPPVVPYGQRPPRKNERNVAVEHDIRVSAATRSQDRVYTNERLIDHDESTSLFESRKQVFSYQYPSDTQPAQDKEFVVEPQPTMKSEYNPFRRNRYGKNPFVPN